MTAPRFSEVELGSQLPPVVQLYDQAAIDHYAVASLDMNPVHTNTEWAARAKVFGMPETVGHGMMTMSTMASVVTRAWGAGPAVRFVEAKFTKPVVVGSTITSVGTVKQKHFGGVGKNWVTVSVKAMDPSGNTVGVVEVGYNLKD
jgi:phosphate acetyltransferase